MKYPDWLHGPDSFMDLPKSYQEYFIRWYYYGTEKTKIPDTIPVENIEEHIARHCNGILLWSARGFAQARNVDYYGKNLDLNMEKNTAEFVRVIHFCAKMYYKFNFDGAIIADTMSQEEFEKSCIILSFHGATRVHL